MAIDASVYGQIQAPKENNLLAQYAQMQQIQGTQNQNRLADLMYSEKEHEIGADKAMASLLAQGGDVSKGLASQGYGKQSISYANQQQAALKQRSEIEKNNLALQGQKLEFAGRLLGSVTDQSTYDMARQSAHANGLDISKMPPQYDPDFVANKLKEAMTVKEQLEQHWKQMEYTKPNANTVATNENRVLTTGMTNDTSRATNAATISNAAQQGNLNRGVTMRGQNMQDARENLVPLETPTGYQAFSKKTGTATPIMSGGQQVQQKDSPLVMNQKLQGQLGAGIAEARKLIPIATASGAGALADTGMGFFGKSTAGGDAAQQLETLAGWMTSNVPRMQGPQSDKDVLLYKQMAAEVGNRNKPVSARMSALDTLEKLQSKYAEVNGTQPSPQANPMLPTKANAAKQGAAKFLGFE